MSIGEIAYKINDLQSKSLIVNSLQSALYVSIFCQDTFSKTDFEWAYTLLEFISSEITKELEDLTERVLEISRSIEIKK